MLAELRISGLGVIDDAVIEPAPGLTVVTGETGAGKTMVVTALGLASGGRADSDRVRAGARRAVVEARFAPSGPGADPSPLARAADAVGGDIDDDGTLLAVRSVGADGRSRAYIGGRSVPVAALANLTADLVAVHGQSEATTLARPATQRHLLDDYAGLAAPLAEYREARASWRQARADLADRVGRARERAQREQLLRLGLAEIDGLDPQPGEDARLATDVRRHTDAEALRSAAADARAALSGAADGGGDEPGASALVQAAIRGLESMAEPALKARIADLRSAQAVLDDVGTELSAYIGELDADPALLESLLERQAALRGLTRRYGEDVDAVLAWARDARAEIAALDTSEDALAALRATVDEWAGRTAAAAVRLTEARTAAAKRLAAAATAELEHLAMGRSEVVVSVRPREAGGDADDTLEIDGRRLASGPEGVDRVDFEFVPHPGAPRLPLARAASGGELSRVMLALEVVLARVGAVDTLVFDEVDAGVGGRAATEIGRRLALLARSHQVIVVTHLAQVAAFADRHYVVDAEDGGAVGASSVRAVAGDDRLAELARMLGGTDTTTALAHAADLLGAATEATADRSG